MEKPLDEGLAYAMWETTKFLCESIQGCKISYTQSDEISLLLTNYEKVTTDSWFDNNLKKMESVATSMATANFNEEIKKVLPEKGLVLFNARVFVVPHDDVNNCFLWRQQDASKIIGTGFRDRNSKPLKHIA